MDALCARWRGTVVACLWCGLGMAGWWKIPKFFLEKDDRLVLRTVYHVLHAEHVEVLFRSLVPYLFTDLRELARVGATKYANVPEGVVMKKRNLISPK